MPEGPGEFDGRVALVTGGGKGIGGAVSVELARRGADVAINFRSDVDVAPDLRGERRRRLPDHLARHGRYARVWAWERRQRLVDLVEGIRMNAVAPGFTRTPRVDTVDRATRKTMLAGVPMGRMGEADEIAAVVAFLLSDAAGYVTGQVVSAAGGP